MATIKCSACETNESITFCSETGAALCGDCAIACDRCNIPLARTKAQITSKGRKLCPKCMAERNAKRKLRREKAKTLSRERKRSDRGGVKPVQTEARAPSPSFTPASMSFDALSTDAPAAPATSFGTLKDAPTSPPPGPTKDGSGPELGSDFGAPPAAAATEASKRNFGLEGVPTEASSRLELAPVDEKRPVMVHSGYRAPTKTAYFFAFLFFGFAGLVFYSSTPILKDVLFPFDTPTYKFNANLQTPIMDTNRLRDTSNISQFEILAQAPTFFIAWLILIVYVGGSALILITTVRSAISSFRAKRRLRKAEKKHEGDPFSSLSGH